MRLINVIYIFIVLSLLVAGSIYSHSGRTDKYGGHNNRKTGGYHFHNPGRAHAAGNPYQDHNNCGICSSSKKQIKQEIQQNNSSKDQLVLVLQAGLKCMGYNVPSLSGQLDDETMLALDKCIEDRNF